MGKPRVQTLRIQTLTGAWHDKDEVMLHAAFQLLVDFVEQEGSERIDWHAHEAHRRAWREIRRPFPLVEGPAARATQPSR